MTTGEQTRQTSVRRENSFVSISRLAYRARMALESARHLRDGLVAAGSDLDPRIVHSLEAIADESEDLRQQSVGNISSCTMCDERATEVVMAADQATLPENASILEFIRGGLVASPRCSLHAGYAFAGHSLCVCGQKATRSGRVSTRETALMIDLYGKTVWKWEFDAGMGFYLCEDCASDFDHDRGPIEEWRVPVDGVADLVSLLNQAIVWHALAERPEVRGALYGEGEDLCQYLRCGPQGYLFNRLQSPGKRNLAYGMEKDLFLKEWLGPVLRSWSDVGGTYQEVTARIRPADLEAVRRMIAAWSEDNPYGFDPYDGIYDEYGEDGDDALFTDSAYVGDAPNSRNAKEERAALRDTMLALVDGVERHGVEHLLEHVAPSQGYGSAPGCID